MIGGGNDREIHDLAMEFYQSMVGTADKAGEESKTAAEYTNRFYEIVGNLDTLPEIEREKRVRGLAVLAASMVHLAMGLNAFWRLNLDVESIFSVKLISSKNGLEVGSLTKVEKQT